MFIGHMENASPVNDFASAFKLLSETLNRVEDEFSGVAFNPSEWKTDGRMYPPQEDNGRRQDNSLLRRYRSAKHYTFFGTNGSVRIETIGGEVLLDKPGLDGRRTRDLA